MPFNGNRSFTLYLSNSKGSGVLYYIKGSGSVASYSTKVNNQFYLALARMKDQSLFIAGKVMGQSYFTAP